MLDDPQYNVYYDEVENAPQKDILTFSFYVVLKELLESFRQESGLSEEDTQLVFQDMMAQIDMGAIERLTPHYNYALKMIEEEGEHNYWGRKLRDCILAYTYECYEVAGEYKSFPPFEEFERLILIRPFQGF